MFDRVNPSSARELLLEVFAGTGGDDAKLFVADLFKSYLKYAEYLGFKCSISECDESMCSAFIKGEGVWQSFGKETGQHSVQRVPPTEKRGRKQTSTVRVAVLPILDWSDKPLPESDIETTTQGGHGPGGQHQNATDSAVRMKHLPTGIEVFINGRKQHQNRRKALQVLTSRVNELYRERAEQEHNKSKRSQLGNGERGGKIRTYNFFDARVTDHRTGKKTRNIDLVMKGRFDLLG